MTDQTAPAWFPPAAATSPQGIPLEPPAAAYSPFAPPAAQSAPAAPAPAMTYAPVLPTAPPAPVVPMPNEGPVPANAIPSQLLPAAGSLAIGVMAAPGAPIPAGAPAPAAAPAQAPGDVDEAALADRGVDVAFDPTPVVAAAPVEAAAPAHVDATGTWWSPSTALVVATMALAWQLVATYARERLPARLASGQPIDRFDSIVDRLPLASGLGGQAVGLLLIAAAGTLVYVGYLRGVREAGLQFSIGIVAGLALLLPVLLAAL